MEERTKYIIKVGTVTIPVIGLYRLACTYDDDAVMMITTFEIIWR